jgi:hypothetical protein
MEKARETKRDEIEPKRGNTKNLNLFYWYTIAQYVTGIIYDQIKPHYQLVK